MRVGGLIQDITYWAPGAEDRYGNKTFAGPALLKGRWEDRNEEVSVIGGNTIVSKAIAIVDKPIHNQGYLALGDYVGIATPDLVGDAAQEIRAAFRLADLRNVSSVHKAVM
jgi:hypothetical protein